MERQVESWQLRSGTWQRDLASESWRFSATPSGTAVHDKLSAGDIGRMVGGSRDASSGQWFPSDFSYSPQTGSRLQITISTLDSPWVPPFGAPALVDTARPLARGLRQTAAALNPVRSKQPLDPAADADSSLPPLPPGHYRFLVHKLDVAAPSLLAIEPQRGQLFMLLPESKAWVALEPAVGQALAAAPDNPRAWRMEVVRGTRSATLYLPTVQGLAVVTPALLALSYAAEQVGRGAALGGPVAWAGAVWLPVADGQGGVQLLGKPRGTAQPILLKTSAPVPRAGFEAPVFDPFLLIWPSEEGQLVARLEPDGSLGTDWIAWPDGLQPAFSLGCPYLALNGTFWQQCRQGQEERFDYVEMGNAAPERVAVDAPRLGTGLVSYCDGQRIVGDPWKQPEPATAATSAQAIVPLVECEHGRAVLGLRMAAPQGVLALLASKEAQRAQLLLQAEDRADVLFGTLDVASPWLCEVFVYDAHLWVYHPGLPQVLGWKLFD